MKTLLRILALAVAYFLLEVAVCSGQSASGVLSTNRAMDWTQAGIAGYSSSGSLPSDSWTQCASIAPYGSSGSYASPNTIKTALSSCAANHYVLLQPGDFYLNAAIQSSGLNNVELRGSGPNSTRLHFNGSSTCQGGFSDCLIGFQSSDTSYGNGNPPGISWTAGFSKGSTSITLANSTGIVVGTMLVLDQCDTGYSGIPCAGTSTDNGNFFSCQADYVPSGPTGCAYHGPVGASRTFRGQQEMVQVVSCSPSCGSGSSTTITISHPLIHPNWSSGQTPQAWLIQPSQYVGVRNLKVIDAISGGPVAVIGLQNLANYWVRNVVLESPQNQGIGIIMGLDGDISSNYIAHLPANSDTSALNFYGSYNLLANNIVQDSQWATMGNGPLAGNVIAYNFFINNSTYNATLWGPWVKHSNGSDYNLWEGNITSQIFLDQAHGGALSNTFYRNFVTGWESCSNGNCGTDAKKTDLIFAIEDLSFNRYDNYIANILGTAGIQTLGYQFTNSEYYTSNSSGLGYIWNIGSGNAVGPPDYSGPIPIDTEVATALMRWGNYDTNNAATQWNTGEVPSGISVYPNPVPTSTCTSSLACPSSFYYSARPSWWASSIPFPAIGPDVTSGNVGYCNGTLNQSGQYSHVPATNASQCAGQGLSSPQWGGHVNANAAMTCSLSLGMPPDGTGPTVNFDAASCYGGSSGTATPTFSPSPGNYGSGQTVTLATATSGATICYTSDGSTPTTNGAGSCVHGSVYSSPFLVSSTTTLRAIATKSGNTDSSIATALYTINGNASAPTFAPPAGSYGPAQSVVISSATSGSTLCYTTDGSTPTADGNGTCTHGTTYFGAVSVSTSQTLKAIASKAGWNDSSVASAAYVINGAASTPAYSPAAGTYASAQTVTISTSTSGATICYTTSGSTPASSSPGVCAAGSTQYVSPVSVSTSLTLKAIATKAGYSDSSVQSGVYTINGTVSVPAFSPVGGSYGSSQSVSLSSSAGATICYTTDGSTPTTDGAGTCVHGTTYSTAISVSVTTTINAIATESGFTDSSLGSATYTINGALASPTFSPAAGTYTTAQSVTISGPAGATLCYTTDGSSPNANGAGTCTHGTTYSTPVSVAVTLTLKAIASQSGWNDSSIASGSYTIAVATPAFSPAPGAYGPAQSVTLSDTTSGATICYTTDGTTPTSSPAGTCNNGTTYSGAISVSVTTTLKAIGTKAGGLSDSAVTSGTYTINGSAATPAFSPAAGTYTSAQSVTISCSTPSSTIYYTLDGSTPTTSSTVYSTAINIPVTTTVKALCTAAGYSNSSIGTALYTITGGGAGSVTISGNGVKLSGNVGVQ